jgi:F-type H+-transporting ATPase subunit b
MRLDWWTLGLQTINFAILVWLLHRFLYRPVLRLVDARKAEITQQYAAARESEQKANAHLVAIAAERTAIAGEREVALKTAATQAQELTEVCRAQATREAQTLLEGGRKTLASEREQALAEARHIALDLGADVAQRVLAQVPIALRADAWIARIEQYLNALPGSERDVLTRQLTDGAALVVATPVALPEPISDLWRERLRRLLGDSMKVHFEVQPELIAGTELRFPTAVLRLSWQEALAAMRSEVDADANTR